MNTSKKSYDREKELVKALKELELLLKEVKAKNEEEAKNNNT